LRCQLLGRDEVLVAAVEAVAGVCREQVAIVAEVEAGV
jgi:hypothetical protein